jgi:hypothetical protein
VSDSLLVSVLLVVREVDMDKVTEIVIVSVMVDVLVGLRAYAVAPPP